MKIDLWDSGEAKFVAALLLLYCHWCPPPIYCQFGILLKGCRVLFQSLHICPKCANVWFELQGRVFVVERRATRRWNRLGPYFWLMSTPKYVHTSGTSYAHIRHTTLKKYDFLMIFVIYVWCAWCVQILLMFSQHLKLFRVDLKLSNEYRRSFVAQKLIPVAQMEIWWKFWRIDFRSEIKFFIRK